MTYIPRPLDTSQVALNDDILRLTELLACHIHDVWAKGRMAEGWRYGLERSDAEKHHPDLVPYDELPESEKEYDRSTALQTIKAILALGYRITK
ncbi:MAG: RyR domain-containing protein [Nitrospira sp.]|nr:RyR domain-containing protein [Nitrospira sp.]